MSKHDIHAMALHVRVPSRSGKGKPWRGSRFWEVGVLVVLCGVLAAWLLQQLLTYRELAEKTAVELTLRNIQTGMRFQVADLLFAQRETDVVGLLDQNPVLWLDMPPADYQGERPDCASWLATRAGWCYDTAAKQLLYLPRSARNLRTSSGERLLRFKVQASALRQQGKQVFAEGLRLVPVSAYRWF